MKPQVSKTAVNFIKADIDREIRIATLSNYRIYRMFARVFKLQVGGVKHHPLGSDHSIWKRKARTWTKTNIDKHIDLIKLSGRTSDIRAIKIWRKLKQLDFPSFYLELSVLEALKGRPLLNASPAENFIRVMHYLANDFVGKTIEDPANQSNKVSHDLTLPEKQKIRDTALTTLAGPWSQAIW